MPLSMMDTLPGDVLFVIIKRIAAFEAEDLFKFESAFPFYQELTHDKAVLRALPRSFLWFLSDHSPSEGKRKLMRQISHSGHGMYGIVSASQMLQLYNRNFGEIKLILKEAIACKSHSAKYFDLILKALAKGGCSIDEILPVFTNLFERKQLAEFRRALANIGRIPLFWVHYWTRTLPLGLDHRFTCTSKGTCKGFGRRPNIY